MKTARKALMLILCAALLVSATVMGTLAYLADDDAVTNSFTVGNVAIVLDEADVDGSKTNVTTDGRDQANKYHLIPGSSYVKDPTVHVDAESEKAWLFVKVENGIEAIEAAGENGTIATQLGANGWTLVAGETNIYAYKDIATPGKDYVVFESFEITGDADVAQYTNATINVTAYAIQAENFKTSAAAWDAYAAQELQEQL